MHHLAAFVRDSFINIKDIALEEEIRALKNSDEFAYNQFEDYKLLKNSRRAFVFSLIQFVAAVLFLIFSVIDYDVEVKGGLLKIIGSVMLLVSSVLFFIYYKTELGLHKPDYSKLRIVFYLFWNLFTIGGFFVSAGFYKTDNAPYVFFVFAAAVLIVPIFKAYENLISAVIYFIPCIYYGISEKTEVIFYIAALCCIIAFFWVNALETEYIFREWVNRRKIKEISDRCSTLSQIDNITGMLNRTGLAARFKERYKNKNDGRKIAVIMADIDNFRLYNHKNGYDRSDRCLYNICNCIRIISKPVTDMVSRFGGDDFILVIEDMDEIEVVRFAEQLRAAVETMALPFGEEGVVTMSIGISSISEFENEDTYSKLLNEADIQLIIAKRSGKNCIGYRNRAFIQENGCKKG